MCFRSTWPFFLTKNSTKTFFLWCLESFKYVIIRTLVINISYIKHGYYHGFVDSHRISIRNRPSNLFHYVMLIRHNVSSCPFRNPLGRSCSVSKSRQINEGKRLSHRDMKLHSNWVLLAINCIRWWLIGANPTTKTLIVGAQSVEAAHILDATGHQLFLDFLRSVSISCTDTTCPRNDTWGPFHNTPEFDMYLTVLG